MASDPANHPMSKHLQLNEERIFANNRDWVASKVAADPKFFENLSSGQHPDYLSVIFIFTCTPHSERDDKQKKQLT